MICNSIGGRFVPRRLSAKYGLDLPEYPGLETCVKLFKYDLDLPEYPEIVTCVQL